MLGYVIIGANNIRRSEQFYTAILCQSSQFAQAPRQHRGHRWPTTNLLRHWLGRIGVKTFYTAPGSPWENGYCESFNSKLRDELLAGELFSTLHEAKVLIERWRQN